MLEGGKVVPIEMRPMAPFDLKVERERLKSAAPDHVLIGDSMLWTRLGLKAEEHLNQVSGQKFYFVTRSGLSPAGWYLALKNIVARSGHRPKTVTVFYRDFLLTTADYRTTGRYRPVLNSLRDGAEPVLDAHLRRAWDTHWNVAATWLDHHLRGDDGLISFPLQSSRMTRTLQDLAMRPQADGMAERKTMRDRLEDRFTLTHLRTDLAAELGDDEEDGPGRDEVRLSDETSYVPAMAAVAKEMGTKLIFYRVKRRPRDDQGNTPQAPSAIVYAQELTKKLDELGCGHFDETPDTTIKRTQYADGDHLKESERAWYAGHFYNHLKPLLE